METGGLSLFNVSEEKPFMAFGPIRTRPGLVVIDAPDSPAERTVEKRRIRKHQVLDAIRRHGPIPRVEIARVLGFNLPSVSSLVDELVEEELAIEDQAKPTPIGRRPIPVSLNLNAACVMGIDVGRSTTVGLLMNLGGEVVGRVQHPTPPRFSPADQKEWIDRFATELLELHGETMPPLAGIGIALPGLIHRPERLARILEPDAAAIQNRMNTLLGVPVIVDNDARMMATGVLWFEPNCDALQTFAVINLGHGLGMGMVINRSIYHGIHGHAGELGHLPLAKGEPGVRCYCGGEFCLETIASGSGLQRMAGTAGLLAKDGSPLKAGDLAELARQGSGQAQAIFDRFARGLACGIGSVISLFNPEAVLLSGRVALAADVFMDTLHEELRRVTMGAMLKETRLKVSELRDNAGPLGTCARVLHNIFSASHISVESIV